MTSYAAPPVDPKRSREKMIREQIEGRGIRDKAVIEAMRTVPRHLFVEEALTGQAYSDHPLPIGFGQTISQPYTVARMSELLEAGPGMKVLEIGTGSGYQAAILEKMGLNVFTVERKRELYLAARTRLEAMTRYSIRFKLADGTVGWPEEAPFDRIIVTAGAPDIPKPLLEQLSDPGLLLIPVGSSRQQQELIVVRKSDGRLSRRKVWRAGEVDGPKVDWGRPGLVRSHSGAESFVDLVGEHGWTDNSAPEQEILRGLFTR